jgi:predicted nucleic acid-binding protein
MSDSDADRILKQIEEDASSPFLLQPSTSAVMEEAARLIDRHPLRTYDALQLAGCLVARCAVAKPLTLVCADVRLCEKDRDFNAACNLERYPGLRGNHDACGHASAGLATAVAG